MRTTGKKGKGKWIVIVVIAVVIIAAASNSGNDDTKNESKKVESVTESSGSTSKDKKKNKSSLAAVEETVRRKPCKWQKLKRRNPALKFLVEVVPSATHWKRQPKKHCGNSAWMLPSTMCGTLKKSPPME